MTKNSKLLNSKDVLKLFLNAKFRNKMNEAIKVSSSEAFEFIFMTIKKCFQNERLKLQNISIEKKKGLETFYVFCFH